MKQLGVVIVSYNSSEFIARCIGSLLASASQDQLQIVVVDNASMDDTISKLEELDLPITILKNSANLGFAAAVNIGLQHLMAAPELQDFWVLNPDTVVAPGTPDAFMRDRGPYSMKSGRILYETSPSSIQIDGGCLNKWTGVTSNLNLGRSPSETPLPEPVDLHFVSGASLVVSRAFIEEVGLMSEDYFLYYEEVDWAARATQLPKIVVDGAIVFHLAGASIGSPTLTQSASAFSEYFKNRSRLKYISKHHPFSLPTAILYGWARAARFFLRGQREQATAVLRGQHGCAPDRKISSRLSTASLTLIKPSTSKGAQLG